MGFSNGTIYGQSGGSGQFYSNFTAVFSNAAITSSAASLTPAGSTITIAQTNSGSSQTIVFSAGTASARTITVAANGIALTDSLYIKGDGTLALFSGNFALPDANTITLYATPATLAATATAITEIGKRTKQNYAPGTTSLRASSTTAFYLPGVTAGVTTPADIPLPTDQSNDTAFLTAVFAGTGSLNYIVGQWTRWIDGPVISQATTTIDVSII